MGSARSSPLFALVLALLCVAAAGGGSSGADDGGTLVVATPLSFETLDPALAPPRASAIWFATCATLTAFRDAPAPAGLTVQPEAAAGPPTISSDGLTYVFTVRPGLRFSDGSPLTAANFARALGRVHDPVMNSPGASLFADVQSVSARGLQLRIQLSRPSGDLTMRLALDYACPVPLGFPIDPAGVNLTGVGSGPYYISAFTPESVIVLRRNRYYQGTRPHHPDQVVVNIGGDLNSDIAAVESGQADVLMVEIPSELRPGLAQLYGVNQGQLIRVEGDHEAVLVLNTSGALFKDNVPLRQAVNFALDRAGIIAQIDGGQISDVATDQIMPHQIPGWTDYNLYPLAGPDLARAQQLAQGNLRGGHAVLYTIPGPWLPDVAQVIASNLSAIGLDVQVTIIAPAVLDAKAGIPGEPYDMLLQGFGLDYPDPDDALVRLLGGANARKPAGNENFAYFDDPAYNQRMAAADRLTGAARLQAFSRLDADIMRNEAPWAPLFEESHWVLYSKRVGCLKNQPVILRDFGAMCVPPG
jgi:peptide/nickel transport system substrate-binding protein